MEAITMMPFSTVEKWASTRWRKRGGDYEALKDIYTARLLAVAEEHAPSIRGRVRHAELSTPLSTKHFMNNQRGEIYGIAATPARMAARRLSVRTPIPGLVLAGADAAGLGVTGALYGGVMAAGAALGRNLIPKVNAGN